MVGETILLAFEAKARIADQTLTLSDDRLSHIREALTMLRDSGLVDNARPLPQALTRHQAASDPAPLLAGHLIQEEIPGLDRLLATAAPYQYTEHERPGQRGLPVLSRHGRPSALARVTDPADPRSNTLTRVQQRRRDHQQAHAAHAEARQAAPIRRHRARRKALQDGPDLLQLAGATT